ncbi:gamma-glutamyl-gamma-aminobutyrate hydrolase family protein [Fimbriimonas ginsengisoli]|uniref:Glutamine amidotransferase, class I n=1 Tax=Fimbriimonas ginsengisoli Gsoil 348 TaxID=661478 RepID=A0A068NTX4_FIMGI|nr:gamma-glutamyl-gamma-aminobutyrate hydrolase family protein [Fimbriimonas ginsengisoli]AIE86215.1 glutamine amidotransferase, class I [Fimbriimonas ginsengisoli Gsoil 348]
MKPIIGITVDCHHDPEDPRTRGKLELNWNYAQAVSDAGGVPVLIPPTADMEVLAGVIHGWLIPGGNDIDAANFGEENHPKVKLQDPSRFVGEKSLFEAIDSEMPVLGICYGCQFLNVARGGTLEQHLPDRVGHEIHTGGTMQSYPLAESRLREIVGVPEMTGKSYHHQAVGQVGEALAVVSKHEDGTVEAVEATDRPWMIGVQWHPERTLEDEATRRLFREFVLAAARFAEGKAGAK